MLYPKEISVAYVFWRAIALVVLLVGWDMSHHSGVMFVAGVIIFIAGIEFLEWVIRRQQRLELMPYRWSCPVCKRKGNRFLVNVYSQEALDVIRQEHNRLTHLLEH